jgi:hypothetical protein
MCVCAVLPYSTVYFLTKKKRVTMKLKIQTQNGSWYELVSDSQTGNYQVWLQEGNQPVRCRAFEGSNVNDICDALNDPWSVLSRD